MDQKDNIRNCTVIAHVDHGKSTLTDALVRMAGISSKERFTDGRPDEQERGISIKATGLSLHFEIPKEDLPEKAQSSEQNAAILVNLIDSPGHVDFSSEVTAALRVTDGALVVVDCVEGVCVQTQTVLRQALAERVKPVLIVNKLDRAILEKQLEPEEVYQSICRTIESTNVIISTYLGGEDQEVLGGDCQVKPEEGTVAFTCGIHKWGFTLRTFAKMLGKKFGIPVDRLQKRLWGDNYYDPEAKKWVTEPVSATGKKLPRSFCQFVLRPIFRLIKNSLDPKKNEELMADLVKLGIELKSEEKELTGKDLMKCIMPKFLPLGPTIVELIARELPSPKEAQKYRVANVYEGPLDDECAVAMRECDPEGPLMVYVSKMVPGSNDNAGRFYAFGRVFSGTARGSQMVRIMGPNYVPGKTEDLFVRKLQATAVAMGRSNENVDSVPCGNIVCLWGIDKYLVKSGTVTTSEQAHNFRNMKFSVSPVVRVAIRPKNAAEINKLAEGLKKVVKTDPCVQCQIDESTGEMIVAAAGELHLEIVLSDLKELSRVDIVRSEPVVSFRETITTPSTRTCLAKSKNKHNRIWIEAEPITDDLCTAIENGQVGPRTEPKERARMLVEKFGWTDVTEARKLWSFGPDTCGPNVLVDKTRGAQYLNEAHDSLDSAFQWATREGPLCGETMRGVRFNIIDIKLHSDAPHRNAQQLVPAARRAYFAGLLSSQPRILEPVYLVEVTTDESAIRGVYSVLSTRRGHVFSSEQKEGTPVFTLKAYLPVMKSFGFTEALREATSGNAFPQCVFDHWQILPGDPLQPGTMASDTLLAARKRKGMKEEIPVVESYLDTL